MSMTLTNSSPREPRRITGRMVLIGFIAFFGVIAAVNGVFMYMAINTWPGLTTEDAYIKGLNYNQTLADGERQTALGWRSDVTLSADGQAMVVLTDPSGNAVSGLIVSVEFARPVGSLETHTVALSETMPGTYTGPFAPTEKGRWKADVNAVTADNATSFRMMHDIMVRP